MSRLTIPAAIVAVLLVCGFVGTRLMGAGDAVLDGKRKLADELFRNGKYSEAATMLKEVIAADASQFRDHLRLARSYDKLNQSQDALTEYRRVLELVPENPPNTEDRLARNEAGQRIKALDALTDKIDSAVDKFLGDLDAVIREADASKNSAGAERALRLKGAIWNAERRPDRGFYEARAADGWQESGFAVVAGKTYRVRAYGSWVAGPAGPCTADGFKDRPAGGWGIIGSLNGSVEGKQFFPLGHDVKFVAPLSGKLLVISGEAKGGGRAGYSGSLLVFFEQL